MQLSFIVGELSERKKRGRSKSLRELAEWMRVPIG